MKEVKYLCAQPADIYYLWQVEVMLHSFLKHGVQPHNIQIVCSYTGQVPAVWQTLANQHPQVGFFFYEDTRFKSGYVSSVRAHILDKHWKAYPELTEQVIFYHDCDIALVKPIDFTELLEDPICYVSDTVSYIGAKYIQSKGEHYLDLMSDIVGISKHLLIYQEKNSGGAQYLMKNIPQGFWEKVYWDSEALFRQVNTQIQKDQPSHAIQIWCADMWAVLWNLWFYNKIVNVVPQLNFAWGTTRLEDLDQYSIYHNAGITEATKEKFYKANYRRANPYQVKQADFEPTLASYFYVGLIEEVAKITITNQYEDSLFTGNQS